MLHRPAAAVKAAGFLRLTVLPSCCSSSTSTCIAGTRTLHTSSPSSLPAAAQAPPHALLAHAPSTPRHRPPFLLQLKHLHMHCRAHAHSTFFHASATSQQGGALTLCEATLGSTRASTSAQHHPPWRLASEWGGGGQVGTVRSSALSWVIQWQRAVRWATLGLAGDCPL